MASKYLQQFPIPDQFPEILHDFTREILRAQPDDIIDFAAQYFDHKSKGTEFKFQSKYNIVQKPNPKQYNKVPQQELTDQARNVVNQSNQQPSVDKKDSDRQDDSQNKLDNTTGAHSKNQSETTHLEEKAATKEFMQETIEKAADTVAQQQTQQQNKLVENDISSNSMKDKSQDTTHPQEKMIAKEYSQNLLDNVLNQADVQQQKPSQEDEEHVPLAQEEDQDKESEEQEQEGENQQQEGENQQQEGEDQQQEGEDQQQEGENQQQEGENQQQEGENQQQEEQKDVEKQEEKQTQKPEEKQTEKPEEKQTEKPEEKQTEKPEEKQTQKPEEKQTDKPEEKQTDKPEEKQTGKPEEKQTGKPEEKQEEKTEQQQDPSKQVVLEGPIEEYEQAALKIQKKFRQQQKNK
eukprot:TRINITY_DN36_c0_g2_i6.p1 TRINITY_DN36_c0_g2~~TRINITY_DN36_c0_g2_i6.p1  ORF type:complete len:406 (+),score=143.03 TRINITY_DN36_c0_g2_i6:332-1549(+)